MNKKNWYIHDEKRNIISSGSEDEMSKIMMILTLDKKDLLKTFNEREIDFYRARLVHDGKLTLVEV